MKLSTLGYVLLLWSVLSAAQATPTSPATTPGTQPAATTPSTTDQSKPGNEKDVEKKEQSGRVLGVLPQFAVTNRQDAPPLTSKQKFHLFAKSAFDPVEFGLVGLQAGLSQAENEFPGYGQGAQGYGKRYGAAFADEVSAGFWSNYFWASALKEDPRYFRLGEGSFKHRFFYAIKQEVVCHTDKGGRSFSFENVLGAFSAGGLSNVYYPEGDRGFSLTMSRSAIAIAYGSLGGLVDEFWPDVQHKLFGKHHHTTPDTPKNP